jgi:dTDP-4-amino-4,6-dideoxygalactose transaminase
MRDTFLPFSPPFLGEEEVDEVVAALRSGWISRGPRTAAFEEAFADRVGAPAALALNSCTAGLHLSLLVHGIGPGDEVVVPTMTFCASANVVEHVGARPVLVDVEPDTLTVDPAAVEAALTERTRAVVVVHYAGHPAEMDALEGLAADHGLALVEDAAHAVPAAFRGRPVGSRGSLASFSFYATKNLTTGEGGMLTGDPELVERARILGLHGMSRDAWKRYDGEGSWYYEVVAPGYKYNMTDVQAALGLRQLERLDGMQRRRREVVARYEAAFGGRPELRLPVEREHVDSSWHLYPLRLTGAAPVGRDAFIRGLTGRRIGTSVHYIPLHLHPWYRERYGYVEEDFPVAQSAYEGLVSLPLHPGLSDRDVDDVVEAVEGVLRERPTGC